MSDDSEDDANLKFGTPLDPYEEDDLPKKKSSFQDIREQYAVDSQGKRRFHGAFTGGFTAGFGNTVATPEGFTPATFKSSRSDRKVMSQRPEDFMDEEDCSEFGIAPRQIQPNQEFAGHKRKHQTKFHDGPIPGVPVLETLLQPAHDTAAMRILKSMGWRPGKGVGEKVTAKERDNARKMYTCFIPENLRSKDTTAEDSTSNGESEDEEYSNLLFEPSDLDPFITNPKTDVFGLGYSGLSRHSVLGNLSSYGSDGNTWKGSHLVTMDKGKKVSIRGQAFGVGALEDDDEDIYAREDMSNYDFIMGGPSKADSAKGKGKGAVASLRQVLEGFVPASKTGYRVKVFPPPVLPRDYVPCPPKSTRFSTVQIGSDSAPEIRDRTLGRHDLTARHRGQILGEEMAGPSSVDTAMEVQESNAPLPEENVDKNGEPNKSSTFKPFASNLSKQLRYEKFLGFKERGLSTAECGKALGFDKLAEWERQRELKSFEQAYKLYRPLTGIMSDRFVSASKTDDENSAAIKNQEARKYASDEKMEAARMGMFGKLTREVKIWIPESLLCKRFNVPEPSNGGYAETSKEKKKPSYSIFEYLEAPVHNKSSYHQEQSSQTKKVETVKAVENVEKPNVTIVEPIIVEKANAQPNTPKAKRLTTVELFLQEKEKEKEKLMKKPQLEFQKSIAEKPSDEPEEITQTIDNFNKIDLYKAVFLSDSESDTEKQQVETVEVPKEKPIKPAVRKTRFDSPPKNIERNTSPPKGIFANLNFDRLNSWQNSSTRKAEDSLITKTVKEPETKAEPKDKESKTVTFSVDEGYYGPKLPEKPVFVPQSERKHLSVSVESSSSSSESEDSWVDVNEIKAKKEKSHKKKKEKKAKKKSKHKHKYKDKSKHKKKKHKR